MSECTATSCNHTHTCVTPLHDSRYIITDLLQTVTIHNAFTDTIVVKYFEVGIHNLEQAGIPT